MGSSQKMDSAIFKNNISKEFHDEITLGTTDPEEP